MSKFNFAQLSELCYNGLNRFSMAYSADDLLKNHETGKISAFLTAKKEILVSKGYKD